MFGKMSLVPRNGHTLVVGIVARISGGQNQKELSLDDQVDHGKQVVAEMYRGEVEYRVVSTTGKGERLDRPELASVEAMIRTRQLDLLVCEDIGRMVRGTEAAKLCGIAVDHGVRVIAPNDCVDTAEDSWEEDVISACRDHVGHNAHTSKRIKHKKMNRFKKFGGATPLPIFGYIVPPKELDHKGSPIPRTYDDWGIDPAATEIYREWFRRLREVPNFAALADWLNERGVPTGPYTRQKTWTDVMVGRTTRNPILKGMPARGLRHTVKHHESGRRVSVMNPQGPVYRECPHLAHVDAAVWDEVNDLLTARNKRRRSKPVDGVHPRSGIPKKRTRFPGQHARCWYCGRTLVWGGNGTKANLVCAGVRYHQCWNSVGIRGEVAAERVAASVTAELFLLDGFDTQLRGLVEATTLDGRVKDTRQLVADLGREAQAIAGQKERLLAAILEYGPKPLLAEKLVELEAAEKDLARRRRELEQLRARPLDLPRSVEELRARFAAEFGRLAVNSFEAGDLLRKVAPEFHVYLVRLCDGGHLLPRARVVLDLTGVFPDAARVPALSELLTRTVTIDLFTPSQRERIRAEVVRRVTAGDEQRAIAAGFAEYVTQAAVHNAWALARRMKELSLNSPYVLVTDPPSDYPKLRRPWRCRFEPAVGYARPPVE